VAELFELVDESAGAVFGAAAALGPVRAEVGVVDLVVDDALAAAGQGASGLHVLLVRIAAQAAILAATSAASVPNADRNSAMDPSSTAPPTLSVGLSRAGLNGDPSNPARTMPSRTAEGRRAELSR
jgi:hypothetical protein